VSWDGGGAEVCLKWLPRHHWVRAFISWSGNCEPGRAWMYHGMIRRDAWRVGRLGFGLLRMPRVRHHVSNMM
jgi:hypothetical protein